MLRQTTLTTDIKCDDVSRFHSMTLTDVYRTGEPAELVRAFLPKDITTKNSE